MIVSINWRRWGGLAGMLGPLLFLAITLIEGWLRPGYNPIRMFVSELALGARGWIQITNFIVYGVLSLLFTRGIVAEFIDGPAARIGPMLLTLNGLRTIGIGLFVTDPAATSLQALSVHGFVHLLFALSAFLLWPLICFVFYGRFRMDPAWRPLAGWTLCAALVIAGASLILIAASAPLAIGPPALGAWLGFIQRISIIVFAAWQFGVARRLWANAHEPSRTALPI